MRTHTHVWEYQLDGFIVLGVEDKMASVGSVSVLRALGGADVRLSL